MSFPQLTQIINANQNTGVLPNFPVPHLNLPGCHQIKIQLPRVSYGHRLLRPLSLSWSSSYSQRYFYLQYLECSNKTIILLLSSDSRPSNANSKQIQSFHEGSCTLHIQSFLGYIGYQSDVRLFLLPKHLQVSKSLDQKTLHQR